MCTHMGTFPQPLRIQIVHIILETLGKADQYWEVKVKLFDTNSSLRLCVENMGFFDCPERKDMVIDSIFKSS